MSNKSFIAFTSGALLRQEFDRLFPILTKEHAETELTYEVKHNNLFGIKTESARQRILTEIKRRNKVVPSGFWDFYETSGSEQRNLLLFFIALKSYDLAMDFHLEVVLQKWKKLEKKLETMDLTMRMDELSSMYEDLEAWSDSTKMKVVTVFLRMLREAGILSKNELNKPSDQPLAFWKYFIEIGEPWFLEACLLSKNERDRLL